MVLFICRCEDSDKEITNGKYGQKKFGRLIFAGLLGKSMAKGLKSFLFMLGEIENERLVRRASSFEVFHFVKWILLCLFMFFLSFESHKY